jgi:hypothetical protein
MGNCKYKKDAGTAQREVGGGESEGKELKDVRKVFLCRSPRVC